MRRRTFMTLLGGAAAWPVAARAQQAGRMRRLGILATWPETDAEGQARLAAFRQRLQLLGWIDGHNLRVDIRWNADSPVRARALAATSASAARTARPTSFSGGCGSASLAMANLASRASPPNGRLWRLKKCFTSRSSSE